MNFKFTYKLILVFLNSCVSITHASPEATIPNLSYSNSEEWQIISPQLSTLHLNQPTIFNGYAVLTGNAKHEVWDISNPYSPTFVSSFTSNHASGEAESHQATYSHDGNGNYYLATVSGRGIDIWNLSDISNPILQSEIILPGINYGDVAGAIWGVSWQGNYIYAGATTNGLYVIDVSDINSPSHVSTFSRGELGGVSAGPLYAMGDLLVVTTPKNTSGIATVNIADPTNPILLDSYNPTTDSYIGSFYGTNAYLATPFRAYDVTSDPGNISESISSIDVLSEYHSYSDDYLYLGGLRGGTQGIWKYEISDPANPVFIGRVEGRDSRWDDQFSVPVGNLLLITDDQRVDNQYVGAVIAVHSKDPDITGPSVKWITPSNGSLNQHITASIGVSLSEWPELKTVNSASFIVRAVGGASVSGSWGNTESVLTFTPHLPLEQNTEYEIVLPEGGIKDFVGNGIEQTFRSTFSTGGFIGFSGNNEIAPVNHVPLGEASLFQIISPDSNKMYEWDLGNGQTQTGSSISPVYPSPGRYNVKVTSSQNTKTILEAEEATLSGGVTVISTHLGFTGTGFVDYPGAQGSDVKISWDTTNTTTQSLDLIITYALGATQSRPLNLYLNNTLVQTLDLSSTGEWDSWEQLTVPSVSLPAGNNTIELRADAGSAGPNIDSICYINPDTDTNDSTFSFTHVVYNPLTQNAPSRSQEMHLLNEQLWVVNPDSDTISCIDTNSFSLIKEVSVGKEPKSIALSADGLLWVVCRESWEIKVVNPVNSVVVETIALPYASRPVAIAFTPDKGAALVTLESTGEILKLDPNTRTITNKLLIPSDTDGLRPNVRAVAINSDGDKAYITRFISPDQAGQLYVVDISSMSLLNTINLEKSSGVDGPLFGRGLPNYLTGVTISPDGNRAWIPSKKDNIDRGGFKDGLALTHDSVVRAITSSINLDNNSHVMGERIDYDNKDRCHSVTFSNLGDIAFVSFPGNHEIHAIDVYSGELINTLNTGQVPQDSIYDPFHERLYIQNFLSRSISAYDVSGMVNGGALGIHLGDYDTISSEPLDSNVLKGKQLFYDASSTKLNMEGYMSCASCHLDGGHDGRTWDFSAPLQEGLRNTTDLRGRAGTAHGRLHWTGNFDEIQDFEGQIRELGSGSGLLNSAEFHFGSRSTSLGLPKAGLDEDLDALAAYLASLKEVPRSPHRNGDGSLTNDAELGKDLFNSLSCNSCHGGEHFTDSPLGSLHDVGTILQTSGERLGGQLSGLDTPTLRGLWDTAPYLHDGSAKTLNDVLTTKNPSGQHTVLNNLSSNEIEQIEAYLLQIDDIEPDAAPYTGIGTTIYSTYISNTSLSGDDALAYADPDGDGWSNLSEFIMGESDPELNYDTPICTHSYVELISEDSLQISWMQREGGVWVDQTSYQWGNVTCTPLGSFDLENWAEQLQTVESPSGLPQAPANYQWVTSKLTRPIMMEKRAFIKICLELTN